MGYGLRDAIQFLTLLPCGRTQAFDPRKALPFFPLCGLLIGGLLVVVDFAATRYWPPMAAGILTLTALALISGALHLDGLADTADGLYSRRTPEKALNIMKDSRIGAIGMVAVVFCLAVKWACLTGLETHRWLYLLIIPAYGRSAVLFAIQKLPYGRPAGGTGHGFFQTPLSKRDYWGVGLVVLISIMLGPKAVIINLVFWMAVQTTIGYYHRKIGCVTGDMLGAMIEITETVLLVAAAAQVGF